MLLQLTVRVGYERARLIITALTEERIAREELAAQAERDRLDAQIAELQARRAAL